MSPKGSLASKPMHSDPLQLDFKPNPAISTPGHLSCSPDDELSSLFAPAMPFQPETTLLHPQSLLASKTTQCVLSGGNHYHPALLSPNRTPTEPQALLERRNEATQRAKGPILFPDAMTHCTLAYSGPPMPLPTQHDAPRRVCDSPTLTSDPDCQPSTCSSPSNASQCSSWSIEYPRALNEALDSSAVPPHDLPYPRRDHPLLLSLYLIQRTHCFFQRRQPDLAPNNGPMFVFGSTFSPRSHLY